MASSLFGTSARFFGGALFSALVLGAHVAEAQTVPGTLVPGRQEERQVPTPPPLKREITPPPIRNQVAPSGSENIKFKLNVLTVTGNEAISTEELRHLWINDIGHDIAVSRLFEIANAITKYYTDKGYMLSFAVVPQQAIDDGNVTINVVEGFVNKVSFKKGDGSEYQNVPTIVRKLGETIIASKPLQTKDVERALMLMNDVPGVQASSIFMPAADVKNASEIVIYLEERPFSVIASADNLLARDLGRWNGRVTAIAQMKTAGAFSITQGCGIYCDVYNMNSLGWSTLLSADGWKLSLNADRSSETPDEGLLSALDFHGMSRSYMAQLSYPVIRSRNENLSLGASAEVSNDKTSTFAGTLTHDRVTTAGLFAEYNGLDQWSGMNVFRADAAKGLSIFSATDDDDVFKSRANGSSDYLTGGLYAARQQWLDFVSPKLTNFSLFAAMKGQRALQSALLSGQQCFYGGDSFGRGYTNGAVSGDHCLMGSVELRYDTGMYDTGMQVYGFADGGKAWRKGALSVGEDRSDSAFSTGVGLRMGIGSFGSLDSQLSYPLTEDATSNGKKTPKVAFSLTLQY